jgi:uncharacterized membrane protein YuzA (DUF378 family)
MLWRLVRRTANENWIEHGLVLGALGGLCGFMASAMVHYNFGDSEVAIMFYFIIGLCLALDKALRMDSPHTTKNASHMRVGKLGAALSDNAPPPV